MVRKRVYGNLPIWKNTPLPFSKLYGTGLAHVPHFPSIGKLITRSDFHRAVD
jgi:hypothetical protein